MPNFDDAVADMNAAHLDEFAVSMTYEVVGAPALLISAIREPRDSQENEQLAAFETIWTTRGQFPTLPAAGDVVTIGTESYIVHSVKPDTSPASDGIKLYLNRRLAP